MVRALQIFAFGGGLLMAVSPAFAQDPLGDITRGLGDLDPTHILSPAPAVASAAPPATEPRKHARHHHHHHLHHAKAHKGHRAVAKKK